MQKCWIHFTETTRYIEGPESTGARRPARGECAFFFFFNKMGRSEANERRDRIERHGTSKSVGGRKLLVRAVQTRRRETHFARAHCRQRHVLFILFIFIFFVRTLAASLPFQRRKVHLCVRKSVWNRRKIDKIDFCRHFVFDTHTYTHTNADTLKHITVDAVAGTGGCLDRRLFGEKSAREKQYCAKCLLKCHFFFESRTRNEATQ